MQKVREVARATTYTDSGFRRLRPRHDGSGAAVLEAFLDVGIACRRLRIAMAERVLDETQVFRRGVEIRAGAVPERMTADAGPLEAGLDERLVNDEANSISR